MLPKTTRTAAVYCLLGTAAIFWLVGCGGVAATSSTDYALSREYAAVESNPSPAVEGNALSGGKFVALQPGNAAAQRKLIYNAKVSAETSDMDDFAKKLRQRLETIDGFVADFNETRYAGDRRRSMWTIRVASNQFAEMLAWFDGESSVTGKEVTSEDVTEEYVDLAARLENKRSTERRLNAILEERPGKLDEVLSVEREIDRVREEVERIEGRLRFLSERVALSTISLTVTTRIEYVAPQKATFGTRVGEAWNDSLNSVTEAAQNGALVAVRMTPWLPIFGIVLGLVYLFARLAWRSLARLLSPGMASVSRPPVATDPPRAR